MDTMSYRTVSLSLESMIQEKQQEGARHAFPMQVHSYHPCKEKDDPFQPPMGFTVMHLPLSQKDADEVARATRIDCTEENGVAMKDICTVLLITATADKMPT